MLSNLLVYFRTYDTLKFLCLDIFTCQLTNMWVCSDVICNLICWVAFVIICPLLSDGLGTKERMVLQGFSKDVLDGCPDSLRVQGSGNACPVPLLTAVLHPILEAIRPTIKSAIPAGGSLTCAAATAACAKFDLYMEECAQSMSGPLTNALAKRSMKVAKPMKSAPKRIKAAKPMKAPKSTKATKKKSPQKHSKNTKKVKKHVPKTRAAKPMRYRFMSSSSS